MEEGKWGGGRREQETRIQEFLNRTLVGNYYLGLNKHMTHLRF